MKTKQSKVLDDNLVTARLKSLRVSPIKLNQVAHLIRGLDAEQALIQLTFNKRRISNDVKKLLQSAIANAENNYDLDIDKLYVKEVKVGKSFVMKRFRARARGRGAKILKPFSNITIILAEAKE